MSCISHALSLYVRVLQFSVLSAENFPQEVRTTGISMVNCSNRIAAVAAQFVNGYLMGPPPHLAALLLVTTVVMMTGGFASRWIPHGGDDDIDAVGKSGYNRHLYVNAESTRRSQDRNDGEHAVLIQRDVPLRGKHFSP